MYAYLESALIFSSSNPQKISALILYSKCDGSLTLKTRNCIHLAISWLTMVQI